jgi:hypothetical protein
LAAADAVVFDSGPQDEREQQPGDQQRLDDRKRTQVEREDLQADGDDVAGDAAQPQWLGQRGADEATHLRRLKALRVGDAPRADVLEQV